MHKRQIKNRFQKGGIDLQKYLSVLQNNKKKQFEEPYWCLNAKMAYVG